MSKTTRKELPPRKWLRRMAYKNQLDTSIEASEQLNEEGYRVPNRLRKKSNPRGIVTPYDDIVISARVEVYQE